MSKKNRYLGTVPQWDIQLLDGYHNEILTNWINEETWKISSISPFLNPQIISRLLKGKFDAIILHSYQYISDWLAFLTAKLINSKVLFYGEMYPRQNKSFLLNLIRLFVHHRMVQGADACLAIGSVAKQVYLQQYHIPDEKIFLAPYAVNNEFFLGDSERYKDQKSQLKKDLGIAPDLPVILCVASFVAKKRQQDLIQAMNLLNGPAQLILVGHGPLLDEIKAYCSLHYSNTILPGFINQSHLTKFYAVADIFVLPSLWEEFGLVVNEAMCAGLPVITSNTVAASKDLIIEGANGFTFPPGDASALAEKLNILLDDQGLRQIFGQRSLDIIQTWNYQRTITGIKNALDYALRNEA